jgi:hypothetical protein
MKKHIYRPLIVVIAIWGIIFLARFFVVPKDFGIWERGYMYGWHRKSNEEDWKAVKIKYKFDNSYCQSCHGDKFDQLMRSPHKILRCENCHGPVLDHPVSPEKLPINKSRDQCLRCHFYLPYPTSGRANIKGIDPLIHNPNIACSECHNPHGPKMEAIK